MKTDAAKSGLRIRPLTALLRLGMGFWLVCLAPHAADLDPVLKGQWPKRTTNPYLVSSIAVGGDRAYLASGPAGLQVLDVSDRSRPRRVGHYGGLSAVRVAVSKDCAYVTGWSGGSESLHKLDLTDPAQPRLDAILPPDEWRHFDPSWANYHGHVVRADGQAGLRIIDVTDPTRPQIIGTLWPGGTAFMVAVMGDYAFLGVRRFVEGHESGEARDVLLVIDISDPAQPREVGSYRPGLRMTALAVAEGACYLASSRAGWDDIPFGGIVEIIDVSDPTHPRQQGKLVEENMALSQDLALSGRYAYVADMIAGLRISDVSNPAAPISVGRADVGRTAYRVAVSGNIACVLDRGWWYREDIKDPGLRVVDITDPKHPLVIGRLPMEVPSEFPEDLALAGRHALIVNGSQLRVIDVSDAANPRSVAATNSSATALAISGNLAYLAGEHLQVFDFSQPTAPSLVGVMEGNLGFATAVAVSGEYACVVNSEGKFYVIGISNPTKPRLLGSGRSRGEGVEHYGVAVDGMYACVVGGGDMEVFDLSDPARPNVVSQQSVALNATVTATYALALANGTVYVGGDWIRSPFSIFELPPFFRSLSRSGTEVQLNWEGWNRAKLQGTGDLLSSEWQDLEVPVSASSASFPAVGPNAFFRLIQP